MVKIREKSMLSVRKKKWDPEHIQNNWSLEEYVLCCTKNKEYGFSWRHVYRFMGKVRVPSIKYDSKSGRLEKYTIGL